MLRRPTPGVLRNDLAQQAALPFSYAAVGATANSPPADFKLDHARVRLGEGEQVYAAAVAALQRWEQFQIGWFDAWPRDTPLTVGEVVAVLGRIGGLWWLNACRIVYMVDETGPICRFGFAYGTLPGHVERGEERFLVELDRSDGSVWYDTLAFSRPRHILAHLGTPLVHRLQQRFREDSGSAMQRAVQSGPVNCVP